MTLLCDLATKYRTDKGGSPGYPHHEYTPIYYELLKDRRETTKNVLEVGIGFPGCGGICPLDYKSGASLFMWEEFFPNANIFGFDVLPETLINQGRIQSFIADSGNPESLASTVFKTGVKKFDLIIDDSVHELGHQSICARALLPYLTADGIYVTEDVVCNHEELESNLPKRGFVYDFPACPAEIIGDLMVARRG